MLPGKRFLAMLACALLLPLEAMGQSVQGTLLVAVEDSEGGRIAGAGVTITLEKLGVSRSANTDQQGEARFGSLPPGTYSIAVRARGFGEKTSRVGVSVSSQATFAVILGPQALKQTIQVRDRGPSLASQPVETTSSTINTVVTAEDLDEIPLSARSFANIALLAPFTAPVEPSDPTKARITAVSFGGSSGRNDVLSVDGGDNSDDYIGGFLQNFSPDVIQEFAVRTAQEDADTGRTVGGSVVITTKRGTNEWHGDEAFYERAAALNARFPIENPAPLPKQPFSRQNYIGSMGGPLKKDKLFFFSSIEYVHENASIAYSPATLNELNALASLASQGLFPGVPSIQVPNFVRVPFRDYLGFTRFDWSKSSRSQWFLRAAIDNYTTNSFLVQQAALPSTGADWHSNYMSLVLGQQYIFSPTWVGSLTFDVSYLHMTETRNSNLGFGLAFPFSSTSP